MHFLSITWLAWIWLTVALYWLAPRPARLWVLTALTAVFLAIHSPESVGILAVFTAATAFVAARAHVTTWTAATVIVLFIGVLFYFKISQSIGGDFLLHTVLIPLGVSYYTFRCVHVILERVKGHLRPVPPVQILGYLFFLPTIVIGPINRIEDYQRDLMRQRFDPRMLSDGLERIVYGYAKITILSNYLTEGLLGEAIADHPAPDSSFVLYLKIVQNGLNLYFQFSGFSDIAIGFARLLGFRVIENFNWPYLKSNIGDFWRSWHISLSQWCRNYVYGVVVSVTRSPALGALSTMVAIGLWHEISLRFLFWGLYHGVGIIVWQRTSPYLRRLDAFIPDPIQPVVHVAKILLTVHFVWLGFVILTADTPAAALDIFGRIFMSWL